MAAKFCLSWKCLDCFDGHKCIADNIDFAPVEELRKGYVESSTKFILDALKQAEQSLEG